MTSVSTDRRFGINSGAAVKVPCRCATTAAITLNGLQTIDGITVAADDRVLVKNQASSIANGIYSASTGNWARVPDFDGKFDVKSGTLVLVNGGTANGTRSWRLTTSDPVTVGSSALSFALADIGGGTPLDDASLTVQRTETGSISTTQHIINQRRPVYPEEDFGAVRDGVTDDTTALISFFNALLVNPALEGRMRSGIYKVTAAMPQINVSGVRVLGAGVGIHNVGSVFSGTTIKYTGGAGASMLTIAPTEGVSAQNLAGIEISGIGFDCNGLAARGVVVKGLRNSKIDIAVANATTDGLTLDVSTTLGEATNTQNCVFRYQGRQQEAPGGVSLRLKGSASANINHNLFEYIDITHQDASAIIVENADNNLWLQVRTSQPAGAATKSIEWLGGASSALSARDEDFLHLSCTLAAIARGSTSGYAVGAQNITIRALDKGNSSPDPTAETGASIFWANDTSEIYDGKWIAYTPTMTSTTGAITTTTGISGRYKRTSKGVWVAVIGTITTNGTGATKVRFSLPVANAANAAYFGTGLASAVSGKQLIGLIASGSSNIDVANYDGTYPGANGETLIVSGFYETV